MLHEQLAQLDTAFDGVKHTSRLIVDLRYNHGGLAQLATEVLGHFIDKRVSLDVSSVKHSRMPPVVPRENTYRGDVIVLVNEATASAAEITAAFLKRYAGARVVAGVTMGAEAPVSFIDGAEGSTLVECRRQDSNLHRLAPRGF